MKPRLYYIHDPMCSWCWGFSRTLKSLVAELEGQTELVYILGGLAPDSDKPMPERMRKYLQNTWQKIEQKILGVHFNFDFWTQNTPRRSTYPACRAVIAAGKLDGNQGERMIEAIQEAYYQQAQNPSEETILINLASKLGLVVKEFTHELNSVETHSILQEQIHLAQQLKASSFPSLVLQLNENYWPIPINYNEIQPMLDLINKLIEDTTQQ